MDAARLEQFKEKLGLNADPFSARQAVFYEGAQRKHNLEVIRHMAGFGDLVMALIGERGTGKSYLILSASGWRRMYRLTSRSSSSKCSRSLGSEAFSEMILKKRSWSSCCLLGSDRTLETMPLMTMLEFESVRLGAAEARTFLISSSSAP